MDFFWERYKRLSHPLTNLVGASLTNYKLGVFISLAIAALKFKPISIFFACFLLVRKTAGKGCAVEARSTNFVR